MTANIHQSIVFKAKATRLSGLLTDSEKFSAITGMPASIEAAAGGAFSTFGGMITGRTVELFPGKRIIQAWRVGNWPEGVYSIVRFDLADEGEGGRLTLTHSGFPEEHRAHLESGWHARYWEPLKAYLG
jgi:activator of HSP90 ATPase